MVTLLLLLWLGLHPDSAARHPDSTYHQHLAAARASAPAVAHQHLIRALELLHGHPDVLYMLARNATALGQPDSAVRYLRTIAAMGLAYDAEMDSTLVALRDRPDFATVLSTMAANKKAIGHSDTVLILNDTHLLAEDVAFDPHRHEFFVSSIHHRKIMIVSTHANSATLDSTSLSPMALIVDAKRHTLWASVAGMAQAEGYQATDSGHTGVRQYDLSTHKLIHQYDLPVDGKNHVLGDMTLDAAGNVIVSDGAGGGVYVVDRRKQTLSALMAPGTFESPQNPAVAPDGRVFVADYAMGIATIDPKTRQITWLEHADTVALNGIDGMYLVGHVLYAIQNGTNPERITRFVLDPDLRRVVTWSVVEQATPDFGDPTHGVVVGNDFYFITNSGWDRFADDGHITRNGQPPRLQKFSVDQPR